MRIYGKTLRQIWPDIPPPMKVVVVVGCLFLVFTLVYFSSRAMTGMMNAQAPNTGALEIRGEAATNFFDPAAATDGATSTALVYTTLTPVALPAPAGATGEDAAAGTGIQINIGIATSTVDCKRWQREPEVFTAKRDRLLAPDGASTLAEGEVRYETPSIVFDRTDRAMPWKVFAYRYFWMGNPAFAQRYGMIVMRGAKSPLGPWSEEKMLLGTAADHPPPPYENMVAGMINSMHPSLAGITSYTRPSVQAEGNILLMTLGAFKGNDIDRIVMLASLDHGKRWVYAGTLLQKSQLGEIAGGPYTRIAGATLLRENKAYYLAAVLGTDAIQADGTTLFRIEDLAKARLARGADGTLAVTRHLPRQSQEPTTQGGGFAAFAPGCADGIITAEHSGIRNRWQLFRTGATPTTSPED